MKKINTKLRLAAFLILAFILFGCARNLPTDPSLISGFYTPGLQYEQYDCPRLSIELDALVRWEREMFIAQSLRIKNSEVQFAITCYGLGDGIEAAELARVRGKKQAVLNFMEAKGCQGAK